MSVKRLSRYYYHRITRLRGNPYVLAGGACIGVFVGLTPTIPFHTIIILGLAFATRTSAIAGIITSWIVCNPLTFVPIYFLSVCVGNKVTPYHLNWEKVRLFLEQLLHSDGFSSSLHIIFNVGYETVVVLVIGGCLIALPISICSYFGFLKIFLTIQEKRRIKHELRTTKTIKDL